ncbi:ligase-associated DNA damage response DEXH box helicase [Ferruginibacter sp. HRS2-29]|uniref:ligase-associated DNA damage response DEXH box helicase n=1 Tax=Ferruginibacter sp. HRS2-29 TaxID=2487334 RepID=UPI0020CC5BCF|nr:ligase-associated DNA damage response DEXH box helicase [Ferruginibacter sp. HRS2-29]MCP9752109.1 ligase-associated DNA damage response DEXH box helicase [Ferruginibacter sp. HRS2-29]
MQIERTKGYKEIIAWMKKSGNKPFDFQKETWQRYNEGYSGIVNAPTGYGKTFSVFLAIIIQHLNEEKKSRKKGLKLLWITPLRSLAKDIARAMQTALSDLDIDWKVGVRNGDTPVAERQRQQKQMPEILLTTPETLHLLLGQKNHGIYFDQLLCVAVDEWHELIGSKRGVMTELAVSRLKGLRQGLSVWGISATIGNIEEALEVLIPGDIKKTLVFTKEKKKTNIISILPDEIELLPWAGHLGLKMAHTLIPIIEKSNTTLIFTNTRGQSEVWYQVLLNIHPDLAGLIALHHGSIDFELRNWIEDALHDGILKVVICTSSLDLGVDFKPVDTVIQIGSPKGVARFLQRAGRSGHSPYETSNIYFLPTNSLELVEAAALKEAEKRLLIENRVPMLMAFDVLIQYLVTLAVGDGFDDKIIFEEVKKTFAFSEINEEEWKWVMRFITVGGETLGAYEEFNKVSLVDGLWKVTSRKIAMNHRMNIGAIVGAIMIKVKFMSGGYIGMVEEYFASRLNPGDSFTLGGHILEFVMIKEMTVLVRKSKSKKAISPSWNGGRMPLSANLSAVLREKFTEAAYGNSTDVELIKLKPLFEKQQKLSHLPKENELLIEKINTKEGHHLFVYPFEGRLVHEVLASLVAYRLSCISPISFSIAMNDYGFELLSDQPIDITDENVKTILSGEHLIADIQKSINAGEMAKRKFRDIAIIAGLIFQGFKGQKQSNRNIQASAGIFFNVFEQFDNNSLLLRQAYDEVFYQQLEEPRLAAALERIKHSNIVIKELEVFTPFSFPIKVDSLRDNITSEKLETRIQKMKSDMLKV